MALWSKTLGQGPEMVLLHGWGMNAGVWESVLPRLAEQFRITVIELPGHGESALEDFEDDLDAWTEACLSVAPAQAIWLGWSLGALLAQRAALLAPERVHSLYLMAATPSFVQREGWDSAMSANVFQQFSTALINDTTSTLKRFLSLQVKGADSARETLRMLSAALAERPIASEQGLQAGLSLLLNVNLLNELKEISVETSWLLGERDTLVPIAVESILQTYLPKARLTRVEGAAHAPFLSHPEAFFSWLT